MKSYFRYAMPRMLAVVFITVASAPSWGGMTYHFTATNPLVSTDAVTGLDPYTALGLDAVVETVTGSFTFDSNAPITLAETVNPNTADERFETYLPYTDFRIYVSDVVIVAPPATTDGTLINTIEVVDAVGGAVRNEDSLGVRSQTDKQLAQGPILDFMNLFLVSINSQSVLDEPDRYGVPDLDTLETFGRKTLRFDLRLGDQQMVAGYQDLSFTHAVQVPEPPVFWLFLAAVCVLLLSSSLRGRFTIERNLYSAGDRTF